MLLGPDVGKPDWKVLKNFLLKEGHLKKELVIMLARQSIEIMSKNFLKIKNFVRKGAKLV